MKEAEQHFLENLNKQLPSAYRSLYEDYYKLLVLYAMNFLSAKQIAEDIVQELFTTMWEKKMVFLSLPSFRTYLYNAVRNASLNHLKHLNVEATYMEHITTTYHEITEEEDTNEEEVYRLLFRTIDRLPTRCREVFLLHMDGKKNEEIATALGVSLETVKTQKKRAMQFIKEQMGTLFFILPIYSILSDLDFLS